VDVKPSEALNVWFDFFHFVGSEHANRQIVLSSSLVEALQAGQFRFLSGDDHFAADFVSDAVSLAKLKQAPVPFAAHPGFQAARLIIDSGMNHAAVAAGLVQRPTRLLFEHQEADPRSAV
jgi:hypothetical protein